MIADARAISQQHGVDTNAKISNKAQRIFDWRDPEFIRKKVALETKLALVKYRQGPNGRNRGRKRARNSDGGGGRRLGREMAKYLREKQWNDAGGSRQATHIPSYDVTTCLLYTSPSPRDRTRSRMPSSA